MSLPLSTDDPGSRSPSFGRSGVRHWTQPSGSIVPTGRWFSAARGSLNS